MPDGMHLSQREKGLLAQELVGLADSWKLTWMGKRDKTQLTSNEQWDDVPKPEETSPNGVPESTS